jgi:hypothetical protein
MLKVFGFVRRNERLTHDEYRAAHVGYHNSFGRRLNNIRGYLLNVRSNRSIEQSLGAELVQQISHAEPDNFDALWDGWGQLMFDSYDDYVAARTPARDRAGPGGLQDDPMVGKVGGDFDDLYAGSPYQFQVDEHVAKPVIRPERKLFKLAQFIKRPDDTPPEEFESQLTGQYATLASTLPGLKGLIFNLRTPMDVMGEFFAADAEGFTPEGIVVREQFYTSWDAIAEYWLDDPDAFITGRTTGDTANQIQLLERELFASVFYREVDETVAVIPNRAPAPAYYHR